jgi:hypothetical protein
MKKLLLFALLITNLTAFAQEITYDDFKAIIPFLMKEDYKGAFETSAKLLGKTTDADDSDMKAQVSYMNIYSAAGMVTLDQMSYEDFEKNTKKFIGKRLKMSGHPCLAAEEKAMNSFQFVDKDGKQEGMTMTTNKNKTSILLFEYYKFPEAKNPGDYIGKTVRCGGILESFEISPTKSKIWIGRIHLTNCTINLFQPR